MFELINIATLASKEKMGSYCWGFSCNTCMWGTKYPSKKKKKKKKMDINKKENNEERIIIIIYKKEIEGKKLEEERNKDLMKKIEKK
jgi:glycine betaine/choline ABC-type transport system substrate-binding protein